jgi:hypothetical protein
MNKLAASLCVVLALVLGIALNPTLSTAAEFSYNGQPGFSVTYPNGSTSETPGGPEIVWEIKTPEDIVIQAGVTPIPKGVELKDVAEKVYKPRLEKAWGTSAMMSENKEITLGDGTKAYYSEMFWTYSAQLEILTVMVSVYKDGKWVFTLGHPPKDYNYNNPIKIVKSLKFKSSLVMEKIKTPTPKAQKKTLVKTPDKGDTPKPIPSEQLEQPKAFPSFGPR